MSTVPTITPAAGVALPRIVYGTAWKEDRTAALVAEALSQGFRGIDTAGQPKHYNEAGVGEGLAAGFTTGLARDEIYVQTKFSPIDAHDPLRVPYDAGARVSDQVAQSFEKSLENLGTDYVDGLVLHSPLADGASTLEAWRALEALVGDGRVRQIGICNCYSPELLDSLYRAANLKPAIVQNRFFRETGYDRKIRSFCTEHGIVYQSFWTLTANPHLLGSPPMQAIATRHGRTPAQVLFRHLTLQDVVPLTGTTSVEHMREDLEIFEFELDAEEQSAIEALLG